MESPFVFASGQQIQEPKHHVSNITHVEGQRKIKQDVKSHGVAVSAELSVNNTKNFSLKKKESERGEEAVLAVRYVMYESLFPT